MAGKYLFDFLEFVCVHIVVCCVFLEKQYNFTTFYKEVEFEMLLLNTKWTFCKVWHYFGRKVSFVTDILLIIILYFDFTQSYC